MKNLPSRPSKFYLDSKVMAGKRMNVSMASLSSGGSILFLCVNFRIGNKAKEVTEFS